MARVKTEELTKHTLNLRTGDMEALDALFPRHAPSVIVRQIVSKFVYRTRAVAAPSELPTPDLDLDL
jgi:hypothetical protein